MRNNTAKQVDFPAQDVLQRVSALETRVEQHASALSQLREATRHVACLDTGSPTSLPARLAAVESRIAALSLAEQQAAAQALLRETYATLEWLVKGMRRARDLLGDLAPADDDTPLDAAVAQASSQALSSLGAGGDVQELLRGLSTAFR